MPNHFKLSNTLLMSKRYISNRFVAMMTVTILDTQIRIQFWQGEWIPGFRVIIYLMMNVLLDKP